MPEVADITLDGEPYMLATAARGGSRSGAPAYERSAEQPAPAKPGRLSLSTFTLGLGWAMANGEAVGPGARDAGGGGGGWTGLSVHAVGAGTPSGPGSGLAPWPLVTAHTDPALLDVPVSTTRIGAIVAGGQVYIHNGLRLYRTVPLTATTWANLTAVTTFAVVCYDLAYFRDDVLCMVGTGADIVRWQTGVGSAVVWRAGYRGHVAQGYAGSMIFAQVSPNVKEVAFLGLTATDGVATFDSRWVDAPIVRMGLFAGAAVIATQSSLYLLSGYAQRVAGPTCTWQGEVEPLFSHGSWVNTQAGDFVFLLSLNGKLYTWLAGGVVEYDPAASGGDGWRRTGPAGRICHGACVAAGHLVVALETAAGAAELWAFDGLGWWRVLTGPAPGVIWPCALNGAGSYDLLVFSHGSTTYRLARLAPRSPANHAYASTGIWTSPLLTAGNADATKVWRQVAAYFSWPDDPGNPASADQVMLTLEYSTDAGETWAPAATETVAIGHEQELVYALPNPPTSRLLQLRVSWSSVGDWAPVLSRLVVDYAIIETAPRRRQWKLKVLTRDQTVRRDGGVLAAGGREQIDALFAAWRDQTTVRFRDIDYDVHPAERTVRVLDIRQEETAPADAGEWGDGVVTLTLAEL